MACCLGGGTLAGADGQFGGSDSGIGYNCLGESLAWGASALPVADAGGDDVGFLAAADGFGGLDDAVQIVLGFEA